MRALALLEATGENTFLIAASKKRLEGWAPGTRDQVGCQCSFHAFQMPSKCLRGNTDKSQKGVNKYKQKPKKRPNPDPFLHLFPAWDPDREKSQNSEKTITKFRQKTTTTCQDPGWKSSPKNMQIFYFQHDSKPFLPILSKLRLQIPWDAPMSRRMASSITCAT